MWKKLGSLLLLGFILQACTTQTFLAKGKEWIPYTPKVKPPLKIEVENPPDPQDFTISPKDFVDTCRKEPDGRLTKFYRCRYQNLKSLEKVIQKNKSPKGSYYYHKPTNTLVITDTPRTMERIALALSHLDIPSPQVKIRVRVIESIRTNQWEHGVEYGQERNGSSHHFLGKNLKKISTSLNPKNFLDSLKPGANPFQGTALTFLTNGKNRGSIDFVVRLFQERSNARVDASPDLLVAEGKRATILSGEEVPFVTSTVNGNNIIYSTRFKPVGVSLMVCPERIDYHGAKILVKSEVSVVTNWTDPSLVGGISNPVISKRSTETTIEAKDGDIFLFGGLVTRRTMLVKRSLPLLGDIPFLGYLFSSTRYETTYSQLTFLLSVEIVTPLKKMAQTS
ncbi:MAG: hypothetical protein D6785_14235 [Planctomycetota bacterium]|nr:MAG: hypothetical protein D6785_14235 [Planctomycetota bacterium]